MSERTRIFATLKGFGTLSVERTLILFQRPICFLCSNGSCHFLFYETYYERDFTEWLVVPVKTSVAKSILKREIPIQVPYRKREYRISEQVFVVKKGGSSIRGELKDAKASDLARLPQNDVFESVS